eukprot:614761-Prymnesium_polylepis.1
MFDTHVTIYRLLTRVRAQRLAAVTGSDAARSATFDAHATKCQRLIIVRARMTAAACTIDASPALTRHNLPFMPTAPPRQSCRELGSSLRSHPRRPAHMRAGGGSE